MRPILHLAVRMKQGYGVSVAVEEIARRLNSWGAPQVIGCLEQEGDFGALDLRQVPASAGAINSIAREIGARAVVAHTSPYFEMLPDVDRAFKRIAWEYGDPTPQFFTADADARQFVIDNKISAVYPHVDKVLAMSEFIRSDIKWPKAEVILLGCDHLADLGKKPRVARDPGKPLQVGTLMRLGSGEAQYKGNDIFLMIKRRALAAGINAVFKVMGRGAPEDAAAFRAEGLEVFLDAAEADKARYLRELDVFISCSQWEGFNLPLAEAAALGTAALAFDIGAHPEVTPLVLSHPDDIIPLLQAYLRSSDLLAQHGDLCYEHVRRRFSWDKCALQFLDATSSLCGY